MRRLRIRSKERSATIKEGRTWFGWGRGALASLRAATRAALALLAAALCGGLHWEATQLVGWATMFATNAEQMSYAEAAAATFEVGEVCGICEFVAAGKQDGSDRPALALESEKSPLALTIAEPLAQGAGRPQQFRWEKREPQAWLPWEGSAEKPPPRRV